MLNQTLEDQQLLHLLYTDMLEAPVILDHLIDLLAAEVQEL